MIYVLSHQIQNDDSRHQHLNIKFSLLLYEQLLIIAVVSSRRWHMYESDRRKLILNYYHFQKMQEKMGAEAGTAAEIVSNSMHADANTGPNGSTIKKLEATGAAKADAPPSGGCCEIM